MCWEPDWSVEDDTAALLPQPPYFLLNKEGDCEPAGTVIVRGNQSCIALEIILNVYRQIDR